MDSNHRNATVKVWCLTTWLQPNIKKKDFLWKSFFSVGWVVGFEPTIFSATNWRVNQLRYTHHINLVRQKGLEPLAYCLEGSCSIQLSYWRIKKWSGWRESNPHPQLGRLVPWPLCYTRMRPPRNRQLCHITIYCLVLSREKLKFSALRKSQEKSSNICCKPGFSVI